MKNRFTNLIYSFLLTGGFLFVFIKFNYDPKGIGLFIMLSLISVFSLLGGTFALYFNFQPKSFLYSWSSVAGLVNLVMVYLVARSVICCGWDDVSMLNLIFVIGTLLSIYMLSGFLKKDHTINSE